MVWLTMALCAATKADGASCSRKVAREGECCWQHQKKE